MATTNEQTISEMSNSLLSKLQDKGRLRLIEFLCCGSEEDRKRAISLLDVYELVIREIALRNEDS